VTSKDWMREAAIEISKTLTLDNMVVMLSQRGIIAVLGKYCPFKPDTVYMEIPRCVGCKHWEPFELEKIGLCALIKSPPERYYPRALGNLETRDDFGCVGWEAK